MDGRNVGIKTNCSTNYSAGPPLRHESLVQLDAVGGSSSSRFDDHSCGNIEACCHQGSVRQASRDTVSPSGIDVPRTTASYSSAIENSARTDGETQFMVRNVTLRLALIESLSGAAAQHYWSGPAVCPPTRLLGDGWLENDAYIFAAPGCPWLPLVAPDCIYIILIYPRQATPTIIARIRQDSMHTRRTPIGGVGIPGHGRFSL